MPEKVVISPQWALWSIPMLHWRVGLLTALVLVGMVVVWSIDGCTVKNIIQAWRYQQDYLAVRSHTPDFTLPLHNLTFTLDKKDHSSPVDVWSGSNGWVYSTHCSFKLYSAESAWNCLKNRWIFFWGDSNHVDTIRNMLNFVLDLPEIHAVPRRFDMNFSNPKEPSQTVRITSIFNGHWNETQNYLGLDSLRDEGFQDLLRKYFSEDTIPDTVIMNSGLHDGVHWRNIRAFSAGADYAASFWGDVMKAVRQRGLAWPRVFYRTTVATGGYARSLAFNPNKMEVFNGVLLEKLKQAGVVSGVIDNFDMTFPWHFDNRCNDGVHYGRAPAKMKWRDGEIGHQYFVDLMLAHVLLNALCAR
uniref:Uncharacterized protein n=1 Tax=Cajanus cajan TaxID=3821 RepID=A0A151STR9_CAJCA|nr:hypothetical protein KK1_004478 [Cajanus cajan]